MKGKNKDMGGKTKRAMLGERIAQDVLTVQLVSGGWAIRGVIMRENMTDRERMVHYFCYICRD